MTYLMFGYFAGIFVPMRCSTIIVSSIEAPTGTSSCSP